MKNIFSQTERHSITKADNNFYALPFVHPERTMDEHDFIYVLHGKWKIGQNQKVYDLKKDSLLILSAGQRHYGISPCSPGTKTMYFHVSKAKDDLFGECDKSKVYKTDILINAGENPSIKRYFEHIVTNKLSGNQKKADLYFELLLCELEESPFFLNWAVPFSCAPHLLLPHF